MTLEKNFTLFSPVHLATLAVIFLTALFLCFCGPASGIEAVGEAVERPFGRGTSGQ